MAETKQLDFFGLFDPDTKAEAPVPAEPGEIVCFPVEREMGRVRQTARQVGQRIGAARVKFWKTEVNRLHGQLRARGLSEAATQAEIDRFAGAVASELRRAAYGAVVKTTGPERS